MLKLYSYWRSSASYRARIALHLKGLSFETLPVHLLKDGGEQHKAEYRAVNPQGFVPCLVDGGLVLNQSLAIIEYLDEAYPEKPLLPDDLGLRAKARAMAYILACDTHPMNNLKVLNYLSGEMGVPDDKKTAWIKHWLAEGLKPLEQMLTTTAGRYSIGDAPGLVDCCIPPLIYSAVRFGCELSAYPTVMRIQAGLLELPEIQAAHPQNQSDAQ